MDHGRARGASAGYGLCTGHGLLGNSATLSLSAGRSHAVRVAVIQEAIAVLSDV